MCGALGWKLAPARLNCSQRLEGLGLLFSPQGDEQRLYELIVRHFLACCSQDAQGQETTVEIDITQERFVAHGLVILARNYLDVYPYDRWSEKVTQRVGGTVVLPAPAPRDRTERGLCLGARQGSDHHICCPM